MGKPGREKARAKLMAAAQPQVEWAILEWGEAEEGDGLGAEAAQARGLDPRLFSQTET